MKDSCPQFSHSFERERQETLKGGNSLRFKLCEQVWCVELDSTNYRQPLQRQHQVYAVKTRLFSSYFSVNIYRQQTYFAYMYKIQICWLGKTLKVFPLNFIR